MDFSIERLKNRDYLTIRQTIEKQNHLACTCFAMMCTCLEMMSFVFLRAVICGGHNLESQDRCTGCPKKSAFGLHLNCVLSNAKSDGIAKKMYKETAT